MKTSSSVVPRRVGGHRNGYIPHGSLSVQAKYWMWNFHAQMVPYVRILSFSLSTFCFVHYWRLLKCNVVFFFLVFSTSSGKMTARILCKCFFLCELYYWLVLKRDRGQWRESKETTFFFFRGEIFRRHFCLVLLHLPPSMSTGCLSVWPPRPSLNQTSL